MNGRVCLLTLVLSYSSNYTTTTTVPILHKTVTIQLLPSVASPLLYEISAQFATSRKQYLAHTFISQYKLSLQAVTNYMYMFLFLKIKTKIIKSAASLGFDKVKDPIWLLQCLLEERCLFLTTACTLQLLLPAAGTHQVRPHPPTPWPSCACDESWSCLLLLQQEQ